MLKKVLIVFGTRPEAEFIAYYPDLGLIQK